MLMQFFFFSFFFYSSLRQPDDFDTNQQPKSMLSIVIVPIVFAVSYDISFYVSLDGSCVFCRSKHNEL